MTIPKAQYNTAYTGLMDWKLPSKVTNPGLSLMPTQGLSANPDFLNGQSMVAPAGYVAQAPSFGLGTSDLTTPQSSFMSAGYNPTAGLELGKTGLPPTASNWSNYLDVAKIGLGAWGAYQQGQQNDFMRKATKRQMALQEADFKNSAMAYNRDVTEKEGRRLDAAGMYYESAANKAAREAYGKENAIQTGVA